MAKASGGGPIQQLLAALAKIDRPGTFCTSGEAPAVLPGLEVAGLGSVGFPLAVKQAKELKRLCEQAPYGKGEATLVDRQVRNVWRLSPERFSFTNPAWNGFLKDIVARVELQLGLDAKSLSPHLYELLLYEKGSFFLPHRDGEKLDRMVATLVVVLPSTFAGGELVVRHDGQEQVVDFAAADSPFCPRYAAFYADCEHEIKPLTSGHRLCLVYNLTLAKTKRRRGQDAGAPRSEEHVAEIAQVLRDWSQPGAVPEKLAVTLSHEYTEAGFAWDAVKGVDRARAVALLAAAKQANCRAYLGLLTLWESGSPEDDDYQPRRYGRYRDDDEEEEDEAPELHKMGEIYDRSLTVEHWCNPDGKRAALPKINFVPEEVVPEDSLKSKTPEEQYEGYTGNEGMTVEHWYRHGAVALWPESRRFDVLTQCSGGVRQAVPALAEMVSAWRKSKGAAADEQKRNCQEFARAIGARWPERLQNRHYAAPIEDSAVDPIGAIAQLGDVELLRSYLERVLARDVTILPDKSLVKALDAAGWTPLDADLQRVFAATSQESVQRNVALLELLCLAARRIESPKARRQAALGCCRELAQATLDGLVRCDRETKATDWRLQRIERAPLLGLLARALLAAECDDLLAALDAHARAFPAFYPVPEVQVPALETLSVWLKKNVQRPSSALKNWIEHCQQDLAARTSSPPQPPATFQREANVKCTCGDCAELNRFLSDAQAPEHRFSAAQDRRSHLEMQIRVFKCDVDCRTDKRSSPHVLVCTKNDASHQRAVAEYQKNLERATFLKSLQNTLPS